ncbi:hypothetical protein POTOM_046537 [Populus tomentosa]|uniref:LIM zinc-binding domain-containing protein n=1 Tax=Populus tomentosa TaxID=118781 RepID=A0A8X7YEV1_POPTO|nr:hypothetical protein POTOM_046537 [Populus tomentosa]
MAFTGTLDKCKACDKTVYFVDMMSLEGVPYHKSCFKCSHCKGTLVMSNYSSMDGVLYCKTHFEQLFKEGGDFSRNFQKGKPERTHDLSRIPSKLSSVFCGTQDKCSTCGKTVYPLEKINDEHILRLPWRENVTTRRASGVLMVDVHSHTHLMLLLMESSTARSTSPSYSWKREPTAMSLHQLHIRDQIPRLRNWPGQTQRKELLRRRKSQKSNLKQSTSCFLALLSFQVARTALSFHVVEYYCRIVFKVCFWI